MNPIINALQPRNDGLQNLINRNPKLAQFIRENQGKSVEQIAQAYGLDPNMVKQILSSTMGMKG